MSTLNTNQRNNVQPPAATNAAERRQQLHAQLKEKYDRNGKCHAHQAIQKNVLLVGRTRSGKSTFRMLLIDPTVIPEEMQLKSGTRDPQFDSFFVTDNKMVLNIVDSPGLFERGSNEEEIRDNMAIMRTIEDCFIREITKLHIICFCMAFDNGINQQDVETVHLLVKFLGPEISQNSCLIITHCESKSDEQREKMQTELNQDAHFKSIAQYFEKGIFFAGAINRDHFERAYESVKDQFDIINEYRNILMDLFMNEDNPITIRQALVDQIRQKRNDEYVNQSCLRNIELNF